MNSIISKAESMQKKAWGVIEDSSIIEIWSSIGATINLVGSLKMGLLINNRDIDFHIYTDPFTLDGSFSAMSQLAQNNRIKNISYTNLLDADDKCIEWHAFYEKSDSETWQIDMIHILKESPYTGHFEKVAERISHALTDETREAILNIKNAVPDDRKVMGIQVYRAAIEDGIRTFDEFSRWEKNNGVESIVDWMP